MTEQNIAGTRAGARVPRIFGGTDEILKERIARGFKDGAKA